MRDHVRTVVLLAVLGCQGEIEPSEPPTPGSTGDGQDDVSGPPSSGTPDDQASSGPTGEEEFPGPCSGEDCSPASACPEGTTETYRPRDFAPPAGVSGLGSYVVRGDDLPPMYVSCESSPCMGDDVWVETEPGMMTCTSGPPTCAAGTTPFYRNGWSCSAGCEVVVHYGQLYGNEIVCTSAPPVAPCSGYGEVLTFVWDSETWACQPACDGGLYDPLIFEGTLVCIPC